MPVDQVLRLRAILETFPHVTITHVREQWMFYAVWYDHGVRQEVRAGELRDLLDDVLERLDAQPQDDG
jgi:hypothetical protein